MPAHLRRLCHSISPTRACATVWCGQCSLNFRSILKREAMKVAGAVGFSLLLALGEDHLTPSWSIRCHHPSLLPSPLLSSMTHHLRLLRPAQVQSSKACLTLRAKAEAMGRHSVATAGASPLARAISQPSDDIKPQPISIPSTVHGILHIHCSECHHFKMALHGAGG